MSDFLNWITGGSIYANIFVIVLVSLLFVIVIFFIVAFIQGREISFWPPKIGAKSTKPNRSPLKKSRIPKEKVRGAMTLVTRDSNARKCNDLGISFQE